ncbi:MAG: hypothetical protein HUJ51_06080 [Eggerthellaceae bacterium]|nr:hypothetical protein [Eggerthellaceae bacterium]
MLKLDDMSVLHEDTGVINKEGYFHPKKGDQRLDNPTDCAIIDGNWRRYDDEYAAWWFCCVPMKHISEGSLPIPVFIRGDDVEFSLRNKAGIINMNGICVWHAAFENKFSAQMEYYQVLRNSLILRAFHKHLEHVPFFYQCEILFTRLVTEFQYDYANLILDAIEDYLEGPGILETPNLFNYIQEKGKLNEQLDYASNVLPFDGDLKKIVTRQHKNYAYYRLVRFMNSWTMNFQRRLTFVPRRKFGVDSYDWAYHPYGVFRAKEIYAIDWRNKKAIRRAPDKKKFAETMNRKEELFARYESDHKKIEREYKKHYSYLTSIEFWKKYLDID